MISYKEALARYEGAWSPPRSKKWQYPRMIDNARALKDTASTHYSIHKRDDGVIYYQVYDAKVATFYPPEADGSYKVEVSWVDTVTTARFFWEHGLHFSLLNCSDGTQARVPYVYKGSWTKPEITATLVFTAEELLDKSRSSHKDVYTLVSSAEDKAVRKEFRSKFDTLLTLAVLKLDTVRDSIILDANYGKPFASGWHAPRELIHFKKIMSDCSIDDALASNEFINSFMEAGEAVLSILASNRAYRAGGFDYVPTPNTHSYHSVTQQEYEERLAKRDQARKRAVDSITDKDFRNSLTDLLLNGFNIKQGKVSKPWGQFRDRLPTRYTVSN
jgi:hypothetical protein